MKPQYNAEHIASRIGQPLNTWPGNCFAIATAIVEAGFRLALYVHHQT